MSTPTPEQIEKLPKWAQDYIKQIESERVACVRAMNEWADATTPSPFYLEDSICSGESAGPTTKRVYVQAHTMIVEFRGVTLRVDAHDFSNCGHGIRLQWEGKRRSLDEVAFVPDSYQQARLVSREDMR